MADEGGQGASAVPDPHGVGHPLREPRGPRQSPPQPEASRSAAGHNEELAAKNDALKKEILLLRSDPRYIEKVARDELGMVKPTDRVYRRVE